MVTVYIAEFGKFNFRAMAAMPEEWKAEVWKGWEQWTRLMERDSALNNGEGIVIIVDFDGFSLANYASPEGHLPNACLSKFCSRTRLFY